MVAQTVSCFENWLLDPAEHGQQAEVVHIAHFSCGDQLYLVPRI